MVNRRSGFHLEPFLSRPSTLPLATTLDTAAPGRFLWSFPAFGDDQGVAASQELIDLAGRLDGNGTDAQDSRRSADEHKRESCRCLQNW